MTKETKNIVQIFYRRTSKFLHFFSIPFPSRNSRVSIHTSLRRWQNGPTMEANDEERASGAWMRGEGSGGAGIPPDWRGERDGPPFGGCIGRTRDYERVRLLGGWRMHRRMWSTGWFSVRYRTTNINSNHWTKKNPIIYFPSYLSSFIAPYIHLPNFPIA